MECSDVMWVQLVTWQLGVYDECQQWERAKYDKIWGAATSVIKLLCDSAMTDGHMDHKDCSHKQKNIIMTTYTIILDEHWANEMIYSTNNNNHNVKMATIRLSGCPATTRSPGRKRSNLIDLHFSRLKK